MLGVVQVAFEGFGDAGAVAGGEQVEQQSAGDRDGEPGFCPRGLVIEPGFLGDGGRDRGDPGFDRVVEESLRCPGGGDASPGGPGAVYWLRSSRRYGLRRPVSVEKILDAEEGRRLVYAVIGGIPVRNYRAEITLAPVAGGTRIRWAASWDRTLAGRLVQRSLQKVYPQIVADQAGAAEKQAAVVSG